MCGSAKLVLFAVQNCVRQAWGCDPNRLRFLYSSTVEPILTYGFAIWAAALQNKNWNCSGPFSELQRLLLQGHSNLSPLSQY